MRIVIKPIPKSGPNGDRDWKRHPYFDYEIHVLKSQEDFNASSLITTIWGFDSWWSSIRNKQLVKEDAATYARKLSRKLKTGGIIWMKPENVS